MFFTALRLARAPSAPATLPLHGSSANAHPRPSKDLELSSKQTAQGQHASHSSVAELSGLCFIGIFLLPPFPLALAHLSTCCPTTCQLRVAHMHTKWCRCPDSHLLYTSKVRNFMRARSAVIRTVCSAQCAQKNSTTRCQMISRIQP